MALHLDDTSLLAAFHDASTREKGYNGIIKKYQEKLYWHIRRMLVDHEDTNDVLQMVLVKIWNGLVNFREDSKLYTWMYRIATNETLTFIEREKKRAIVSLDQQSYVFSNKVKADTHFNENQLVWRLQLAIKSLPEKQQLVFNLRYYDEMTYQQMSELLETSEGALKASYHHAAKKIEAFIKSY
jgi:RNA polymerase sigma-70 factor (ECF subfamily)